MHCLKWKIISKRDVLLAFQENTGSALAQVSDYSDKMVLAKAAKILIWHILEHKTFFSGTFHERCVQEIIPSSLIQFVSMIEHGTGIKSQLRFETSKKDLVIAQVLQYCRYAKSKEGKTTHRHSRDQETPFPVYVGVSNMPRQGKGGWRGCCMIMVLAFPMTEYLKSLHSWET